MLGLISTIQKTAEGYPQYRTRTSLTTTNASTDYIWVSASSDFNNVSSDFSISGWIKLTEDASSVDNTDGYCLIDVGNASNLGWDLRYIDAAGDDEAFSFRTHDASGDGTTSTVCKGDTDIDHARWYHVVATYDTSATTAKIYFNGALDKTNPSMVNPADNSSTNCAVGASQDNEIPAVMCEIVYWQGVTLSAAQVSGLYNGGRPRHGLSCERGYIKGWWKLNGDDEGAAKSDGVLDSSGNSHTGTTGSGLVDGDFETADVPTV